MRVIVPVFPWNIGLEQRISEKIQNIIKKIVREQKKKL